MKAISLWQPWATAIALGLKKIETRSWATNVRGRIAIHAALRATRDERDSLKLILLNSRPAREGFAAAGVTDFDELPRGAIVATCELADCVPVEVAGARGLVPFDEFVWGNFTEGRFAWILRDVRPLTTPVPFTGRQGFFDWSESDAIPTPADASAQLKLL